MGETEKAVKVMRHIAKINREEVSCIAGVEGWGGGRRWVSGVKIMRHIAKINREKVSCIAGVEGLGGG